MRRYARCLTASRAILKGLADDGGLFVPQSVPALDIDIQTLAGLTYKETAFEVMRRFLTDFTEEELKYCIENAYDEKFEVPEAARLRDCSKESFLELYHGKTIAFKDMALSILPYLMTTSASKNGMDKEIVILTATSGDTGKAAMAGFADVPGTRIIVFYPKDGVSPVQERQMVTQKGENTCVIAVKGNFDDAQTGVKKIFNDKETAKRIGEAGFAFSSANSINIGRLVPQVVYYVWSYAQMFKNGRIKAGEKINFVVPTGNFGNILAAYYASKMGIPVNRLICASNVNNVLFDFFSTGVYNKNREFILTSSPSMDILVSSNLERLLFYGLGMDDEALCSLMKDLGEKDLFEAPGELMSFIRADFDGASSDDGEAFESIKELWENVVIVEFHTYCIAIGKSKSEN